MTETRENRAVPKNATAPPHFLGENAAGQAASEPSTTRETLGEVSPRIVRFIITEADVETLDDIGGPNALGEVLSEAVERHSLARILDALHELDTRDAEAA